MFINKRKNAFTMIELLIATLVMSIGILGYISNQMNTIFNISYSYKVMHITNISSDFINIVLNEKLSRDGDAAKKELTELYIDSVWNEVDYSSDLMDCQSSEDIEDVNICGDSERVDYNVMKLKKSILTEVPDATFSMFTCESGVSCLTIAWKESSNDENECKSNVSSCILLEF